MKYSWFRLPIILFFGFAIYDTSRAQTSQPNLGNCSLKIRVSKLLAAQFYRHSLEFYKDLAMNAQIRGLAAEDIRPQFSSLDSGLPVLNRLTQDISLGGGAMVESFVPDYYMNRLIPEIQEYVIEKMPSLVVKFRASPLRLVNGLAVCDPGLVKSYKALLDGSSDVEGVSELAPVVTTGEILEPAKRPLPNDEDFIRQWGLDCSGQTLTVENNTFTCTSDSHIRYLVGPRQEGSYPAYVFLTGTGLWPKHPDFDPQRIKAEWGINVVDPKNPNDLRDENGHETLVAGTGLQNTNNRIFGAGTISTKIFAVPVKMFGRNAISTDRIATMAMLWPANKKLELKKQGQDILAVISASWISYKPESNDLSELRAATLLNLKVGIPVINAAGNGANNNDAESDVYPALWARDPEFEEAAVAPGGAPLVTVAASGPDGKLTSFSGYGEFSTTIAAPGIYDRSTVPPSGGNGPDDVPFGSPDLRADWKGTSAAQPKVSFLGVAELLSLEGSRALINLGYRVPASGTKNAKLQGKTKGGLLNLYELKRPNDRVAPRPIENVKITEVTYDSAKIGFVVPPSLRRLGLYDFRYMIGKPIDDQNFWWGIRVRVPWPKESGEREEIKLKKLPANSSIHPALRLVDMGGNHVTTYLPPIQTNPVHLTWLETSGKFFENLWQFKTLGQFPNLWHFEKGELVYRVEGQKHYDTSDPKFGGSLINGGLALGPEQLLPKDPILNLNLIINTGTYRYDDPNSGNVSFEGDELVVLVFKKDKPSGIEVARFKGSSDFVEEKSVLLDGFGGETVRIGFLFKVSPESAQKKFPRLYSGIVIKLIEVFGTRTNQKDLPEIPNGNFESGKPSAANSQLIDPNDWLVWLYCPNCPKEYKILDEWYGRLTLGLHERPRRKYIEGRSALKLWNGTLNPSTYVLALSKTVKAKPSLYELQFSSRLVGELLVIVNGLTKDSKEIGIGSKSFKSQSNQWQTLTVPFNLPPDMDSFKITLGLKGDSQATKAYLDDLKIQFLTKTFDK